MRNDADSISLLDQKIKTNKDKIKSCQKSYFHLL